MLNLPPWPDRTGQLPTIEPVGTENGWPYPEPLRGDLIAGADVWREVSEEVYWNQLEAVPPKRQDGGYFLAGETYSHAPQEDGSVEEYYTAFAQYRVNGVEHFVCRHVPLHCWQSEIQRLMEVVRRQRYLVKPDMGLRCACCGGWTRGRQWHNQDDGFGLCTSCAERISKRETPEYMERVYGVAGVHYSLPENGDAS